ncbi:MAG: bifunctional [glutamine synthetase] adenylyltransferase/[glutamine synthetase]-adenylyl-L-tyrosine phosphorylase [Cellulomonadaceae bacterium]|jgi:glutamate-ammonia-ligase adenylyltransferase|nr:bifunctional [glutamine synthetase] adenylyltransferase/[glutamine synthetase]-adenylyl-L-tyrosine phosphorylase [Cellulomonadaceae bacterium]
MLDRELTLRQQLLGAALVDLARAEQLWTEPKFAAVLPKDPSGLLTQLRGVAEPDSALASLAAIAQVADPKLLSEVLSDNPNKNGKDRRTILLAILGTSAGLGEVIARRPELLNVLGEPHPDLSPAHMTKTLENAVQKELEKPGEPQALITEATNALRREYRSFLLQIAALDFSSDPLEILPTISQHLADLAAAALQGGYQIANFEVPESNLIRFAIIGMGKTGGRELNYVSDVDVLYVVEPKEQPDGSIPDEIAVIDIGTKVATAVQRVCAAYSTEPALWEVDANLRPEGKQGQLVRTLSSYLTYYQRWAENWEFQALLKSRPIAGDLQLGQEWRDLVEPLIWQAVARENFVVDLQAMRQRVVDSIPKAESERQIKLGRGGLRDIEFTVQLLQLVHGRTHEAQRVRGTFEALKALADAGFVARSDAAELERCYRFLRALEHRVQLHRMRRTHLLPKNETDLRRLGRSLGPNATLRRKGQRSAGALEERYAAVKRQVKSLHESIYYRPLLPAYAKLSEADISLTPDAAKARLEAIGYRDPVGATRHIAALTEGTSRRAVLQRQLLPVMLSWLGDTFDPDQGLLAFRRLSDELGTAQWFLKLLRDSGTAAHSLAHLLGNSGYLREAVTRAPQTVQWLAEPEALKRAGATATGHSHSGLRPAHAESLAGMAGAILGRAESTEQAVTALRSMRRRELARIAASEVLGRSDRIQAATAISDLTDLTLQGALRVARQAAREKFSLLADPADILIVAMGRLGGRELGYGSDADIMFVYEPHVDADSELANEFAIRVATEVREMLGRVGPEPALVVDSDLRPEGRRGALARSFSSYQEYYARWMDPWEIQALLRARPVAGAGVAHDFLTDRTTAASDLAARFIAMIDPIRYPVGGLKPAQLREIRRLKARMEAERLPRGVDPVRHLKLGPGGLSDVEWTAQLLQLQHAGAIEELRVTSTSEAIAAAHNAQLLDDEDAEVLNQAWSLASRLRSAIVLSNGKATGGAGDVLPHNRRDLTGVAATMAGYDKNGRSLWLTAQQIEDMYLKAARRARRIAEQQFFGDVA